MIRNRRLLAVLAMLLGLVAARRCLWQRRQDGGRRPDTAEATDGRGHPRGRRPRHRRRAGARLRRLDLQLRWRELGLLDDGRHHDAPRLRRRAGRRRLDVRAEHPARRRADAGDRPRSRSSPTRSAEDAVWSDGEPITSTDFKYTWEQVTNGKDIYDTTGYADIESVDDSDPTVAVVTFETATPAGRASSAAASASTRRTCSRARTATPIMANGYDFSGGPWKIEKWDKGVDGRAWSRTRTTGVTSPSSTTVIFQFITDTAAEFQAFKAGEVLGDLPAAAARRDRRSINAGI